MPTLDTLFAWFAKCRVVQLERDADGGGNAVVVSHRAVAAVLATITIGARPRPNVPVVGRGTEPRVVLVLRVTLDGRGRIERGVQQARELLGRRDEGNAMEEDGRKGNGSDQPAASPDARCGAAPHQCRVCVAVGRHGLRRPIESLVVIWHG